MDRLSIPGSSPYFGVATGFSKSFQIFIKEVGEARSKYDEDKTIRKELARVREASLLPTLSLREKKENMICLIYGHLLGHDVSFGYMNAINLAEQSNQVEKRVGYLTLSLVLDESHEMTLLLMNTIRKDLLNKNLMIKSFALTAASRLVSKAMLPMILSTVKNLVNHDKEIIRKKAINLLCKFYQMDPEAVKLDDILQRRLCDHDAGVLGNVMNGLLILVSEDRLRYRSLSASIVSILKQILEGRIPSDFNYYGIPAPWTLITALRVLAELGADDLSCSQEMYEVLALCFEKIGIDSTIGCAVTYECMRTVTSIYPDPFMLDMVTDRLGAFFLSSFNNMKYIGINMLGRLISIDMKYAEGYQNIVIDSLNDADETLKRKTLDLLYQMTNSGNVDVVCGKLLGYLRCTIDSFFRTNLVTRITKLAERFAPDDMWYVKTVNEVLEVGGNLVNPAIAYNVMRLIGEGNDNEEEDVFMKQHCLAYYMDVIEKPNIPDILTQLAAWVIGEYSSSSGLYNTEDVLQTLISLLKKKFADPDTKGWVLSAIIKIHGQVSQVPDNFIHELQKYSEETDCDLRQRCSEAIAIAIAKADLSRIVPIDASCEDIEVESSLAFLEEISEQQVAEGVPSYNPEWRRAQTIAQPSSDTTETLGLNFTPYTLQGLSDSSAQDLVPPRRKSDQCIAYEASQPQPAPSETTKPKLWTAAGYVKKERLDSLSTDYSDSTSEAESAKEDAKEIELPEQGTTIEVVNHATIEYRDSERERFKEALFQGSSADTRVNNVRTWRNVSSDTPFRLVSKPRTTENSKDTQRIVSPSMEQNNASAPTDDKGEKVQSVDDLLLQDDRLATEVNPTDDSLELKPTDCSPRSDEALSRREEPVVTPAGSVVSFLDSDVPLFEESKLVQDHEISEGFDSTILSSQRLPLVCDENVRISVIKEEKPTELLLVMYITNQTPNSITKFLLSIKAMSNLEFKLDDAEELTRSCDVIAPRRTVHFKLSIQYKSPLPNMTITAEVSYRDKAFNTKLLLARHELSYLDLIRPVLMNATEFKDKWLKVGLLELSKTCQARSVKSRNILEAISADGHLNIVDTDRKGNEMEILAAGSILGKTSLLLYIHVSLGAIKLLIRSDNSQLNDCVFKSLQMLLGLT